MNARKESSGMGEDGPYRVTFTADHGQVTTAPGFYLVDLAKYPGALRLLFEHEQAPVYDFPYLLSSERDIAYQGPLLIEPVGEDCRDWLDTWFDQGKTVALHTEHLALQAVSEHLVGLNRIQSPHGPSLFRYADPATFASVGPSLSLGQRLRILGPLSAVRGHYVGQNWCLSGDPSDNIPGSEKEEPLRLTRENLAFITRYRLELLAASLTESNSLAPGLVSRWFHQLETLGAPSEQGLIEGSELLIRQGLTRPLDDGETEQIRQAGSRWSDKMNAIVRIRYQEGT